jgi:pSer/pThr/pTyr-binding forkhead associated (FHA) protein
MLEGEGDVGRELPLTRERIIIGRGEFNDIALPGKSVSRAHAAVLVRNGEYWIEDLNSQNGVVVNGEAIVDGRRLTIGDRVQIGEFLFEFVETVR